MKPKLLVILGLAILIRVAWLGTSSHFLSDESRDLVNIHQIWVEKKLTLVGPISDDRSHVFSSLTYYMLLPFAALGNFDPLSTVLGAVFWGLIVWILAVRLGWEQNREKVLLTALLAAVWFPLVQTSRWPWNPNLMLPWLFAGIWLSGYRKWQARILSGLCFGLAIHHHYLAAVPAVLMVIKNRDLLMAAGEITAIIPFVIFDQLHPPGIFISRMIDYNRSQMQTNPLDLIRRWPGIINYFANYIFGQKIISVLGLIGTILLAGWDIGKKTPARSWLIIWMVTLLPLGLYSRQFHYLLPALPFFFIWLVSKRTNFGSRLAKYLLIFLLAGSLTELPGLWRLPDWEGNLKILRGATDIMAEQITAQKLINPNLAVLASPDIYPAGKKYRDLLLVKNIRVKMYEEYGLSDNLFVVTKSDVETIRKDPAAELLYFRNGPIAGQWPIQDTGWKVIQINRY
jgi:hypothetical protein